MQGKKIPLYGDGLNVRDWLHVDDHCRGIQLVIEKGRAGQIYNIGGGTELTNIALTNLILSAMGASNDSIEAVEDRKAHDRRYSVDITKIHNELGYSPQCTLEDSLSSIVEWYKNNQQWWTPLKANK
jgi:dTDP-glucose 4,6-dehydratase